MMESRAFLLCCLENVDLALENKLALGGLATQEIKVAGVVLVLFRKLELEKIILKTEKMHFATQMLHFVNFSLKLQIRKPLGLLWLICHHRSRSWDVICCWDTTALLLLRLHLPLDRHWCYLLYLLLLLLLMALLRGNACFPFIEHCLEARSELLFETLVPLADFGRCVCLCTHEREAILGWAKLARNVEELEHCLEQLDAVRMGLLLLLIAEPHFLASFHGIGIGVRFRLENLIILLGLEQCESGNAVAFEIHDENFLAELERGPVLIDCIRRLKEIHFSETHDDDLGLAHAVAHLVCRVVPGLHLLLVEPARIAQLVLNHSLQSHHGRLAVPLVRDEDLRCWARLELAPGGEDSRESREAVHRARGLLGPFFTAIVTAINHNMQTSSARG
eukprot:comp21873_c0_seq2/m.49547 comp21873_c0_seq2/g.49547  ORF comp21873_c0_seq2/g.49547 comp21873_c0_seq2/m.49547 type:complete len:392 (-) comp21873_c0_seq2:2162-3337(-)